jgi:hypothetical protein
MHERGWKSDRERDRQTKQTSNSDKSALQRVCMYSACKSESWRSSLHGEYAQRGHTRSPTPLALVGERLNCRVSRDGRQGRCKVSSAKFWCLCLGNELCVLHHAADWLMELPPLVPPTCFSLHSHVGGTLPSYFRSTPTPPKSAAIGTVQYVGCRSSSPPYAQLALGRNPW